MINVRVWMKKVRIDMTNHFIVKKEWWDKMAKKGIIRISGGQ